VTGATTHTRAKAPARKKAAVRKKTASKRKPLRTIRADRARAKREGFIEGLRFTGNVSAAARAVGWSRRAAYDYRDVHDDFAQAWDDAIEEATDALEEEARRRAVDGVVEPVYHQGQVCGGIKKYSDRMLEILLKGHRPEKFRERHEHTGPGGGPIPLMLTSDDAEL